MAMNVPLGLVPSRTVFHLGLRGMRRRSAALCIANRLLSTSCITPKTPLPRRSNPALSWPGLSRHPCSPWHHRYSTGPALILDRYEDLPDNYTDKEGLSFRQFDLTDAEVKRIFGPRIKGTNANRLLRILHGRRVAGTLSDPSFHVNTAQFTQQDKDRALEYLRKTVPVDEVLNAGLRAEDELRELEREAQAELEGVSDTAASDPDVPKPNPVYGESAIDRIRAENIAKRREQERLEALEREEREKANPGPLAKLSDRPREISPRMQKWMDQATSDMKEPPKMTHCERLLPGTVVVFIFVAAAAGFAALYTPPSDRDRLFPEVSAGTATIASLIALNAGVWFLWRIPPLWKVLNRYFVLVHGLPRASSLVFSTFSHSEFTHLVANMAGLYLFGTLLHEDVGRGNFLAIYLASGALGALGSLWLLTLRGRLMYSTLGASGAVYGIMGAYFWRYRFENFRILGFPPEPLAGPQGLGLLGLIVGLHIWGLLRPGKMTMDLTAHMVGMATGIFGAHLIESRQSGGGKTGWPRRAR
ncbi:rhomboid-domain-containing protein [Sodiomyces alkalinus F11]|uniref:Rhomboid-domain-containing protein n=1 Tax=Sodiomyces alkalinus (strain CBS 110278 / VKM F-3762 / F11) TaxID=1314773 RepID=A0A3N2PYY1_SODAK|nr:rhomboid-domain-containing protein [Sodiomyces alkalinus F11]ROT39731.1 rhomboid-domain-containing protein [Sodiomyces alkalinus F11]